MTVGIVDKQGPASSKPASGLRASLRTRAPLLVLLLFAAVYFPLVVLPYALHGIVYYDEALMFHTANRVLHGQRLFGDFYGAMSRPHGMVWFLEPHILLWGRTTAAIMSARVMVVLLFLLMGLMAFGLARRCAGRAWVGTTAALVLWTEQHCLRYAGYALGEVPAAFFVVLSLWVASLSTGPLGFVLAGVAGGLAGFMRVEALLFVIPLALAVLVISHAHRWRNAGLAVVGYAAPWAVYATWLRAHGLWSGFIACVFKFNMSASQSSGLFTVKAADGPRLLGVWPQLGGWDITGLELSKLPYLLAEHSQAVGWDVAKAAGLAVIVLACLGLALVLRSRTSALHRGIVLALAASAAMWYGFYMRAGFLFKAEVEAKESVLPSLGLCALLVSGLWAATGYAWRGRRSRAARKGMSVLAGLAVLTVVFCWLPIPLSLPIRPFQATVRDQWDVDDVIVDFVKKQGAAGSVVTDSYLLLFLLDQPTPVWWPVPFRETEETMNGRLFPNDSSDLGWIADRLHSRLFITQWQYSWDPENIATGDPAAVAYVAKHFRPDAEVGYLYSVTLPGQAGRQTAWPMGYRVFRRQS